MSRWGEMFYALSRGADTVDTVDTVAEADALPRTVSHSVHSVTGAERRRAANPPANSEQPIVADADELEERAALIEEAVGIPRDWAEGYAALCTMLAPAGFSPDRWQRIVDAAGTFIDRWAVKAAECGWSDRDVFGCDAAAPDRRFDCMGLVLLLERMQVVGVDEHGADLRSLIGDVAQRYRRKPFPTHTIRLWDLVAGGNHPPDAAA